MHLVNLAVSPPFHVGGHTRGAQQRSMDVPKRWTVRNHHAIGTRRLVVAREGGENDAHER